jgi:hypothetical protein
MLVEQYPWRERFPRNFHVPFTYTQAAWTSQPAIEHDDRASPPRPPLVVVLVLLLQGVVLSHLQLVQIEHHGARWQRANLFDIPLSSVVSFQFMP